MTHRKRGLVAGILFLAVALTPIAAVSGPFEDGLDAYNVGDYVTAWWLWRPLAEQGNAHAEHALGVMYDEGQGVPQDDAEAVKWYRLAADQGLAEAQYNLGNSYQLGQGVPQDDAEAVAWYRLSAEQGLAAAQHNLAGRYTRGQGVPQDYVQAHMWYSLAASRFPPGERHDLAVQGRDFVTGFMTPDQIAKANKLAREWKPRGEQAN